MKALILWAESHSANFGVRALGEGSAALLERVWPGIETSYQGYGPGAAPTRIGSPKTLLKQYFARHSELTAWVKTFDLVLDTRAGDSFADIYGVERLLTMSGMAEVVKKAGVPLVMGPQTIGPFDTRLGRMIGRRSLHAATAVLTRDSTSTAYAKSLGRKYVGATTDVVFALPVPEVAKERDVMLNVSGLLWNPNPHVDSASYRSLIRGLIAALLDRGRKVALLAHVLNSDLADNDVPAVKELAVEWGDELEVCIPRSLGHVRHLLASAEMVIGSRMHACLNGLSVGTPAVSLAYSRKFEPLLNDLGWPYTVDLRAPGVTVHQVLHLTDRSGLGSQVEAIRAVADEKLGIAERLISELA